MKQAVHQGDSRHLDHFSPRIRQWFTTRVGRPTPIQRKAWPLIAGSQHVLIMSPTGSGKTLAAFLWALDQLIRGRWEIGQTRVLYLSPLKALNNDVRRNLIRPLREIRRLFEEAGEPFPDIRVATRSGDTPAHERRQMVRRPPEILITTPESLHLMLSSRGGSDSLRGIRSVILDEIHAVLDNKRGTLLMSAVERLVPRCGEFQRIALSATIRPISAAAAFVAGYTLSGDPEEPVYTPRRIEHCRIGRPQPAMVRVRIPQALVDGSATRDLWDELAATFRQTIEKHRATIIFTNSRRLCEKLTFLINGDRTAPIAYSHHGSLSRELRLEVEQMLKRGNLRAIVATASLELGIDIGSLDQVILVQSPPSIASATQRIGRSGHAVGEIRKADFVATHAMDAVNAAVMAGAVMEAEIEAVRPPVCPLDVLAQVVVSMTGLETWDADALFHKLRTAYPYRQLTRKAFDLVIEMLAGRYADTRIAALQPKIAFDRLDHTLTARKGALLTLYLSGGVIPDRGYFALRHEKSGARIGELDEEFVWEARKGQVFTLGTQNWRIRRITTNDVFVTPASPKAPAPPFWRAEDADRSYFLSDRIGRFLEEAEQRLTDPDFRAELGTRYHLDEAGARYVVDFLSRQRQRTGCALPHRHHVVLETMPLQGGGSTAKQIVLHTFWGGRVNRPYALALTAAWEDRYGYSPSVFPTNDAIYLTLTQAVDADEILHLVPPSDVERLVRKRLEGSGLFGARFRECAARALLLPRHRFNQRMPLWLSRQQAQRLMDAVRRLTDFPILLESWRSCVQDDFDLAALGRILREVERGAIGCTAVKTSSPSPMALSGAWRQVNHYMYADDRQPGKVESRLARDLIEEIVFTPELRPAVNRDIADRFQEKRQRLHPGYAPDSPVELLEWVKERLMIPRTEWQALLENAAADAGGSAATLLAPIEDKLLVLVPAGAKDSGGHLIVAAEMAPLIAVSIYAGQPGLAWLDRKGGPVTLSLDADKAFADDSPDAASMVGQWLRFYGPLEVEAIRRRLGLDSAHLSTILSELIERRLLISGRLIHGHSEIRVCHAEPFDTLLRMARRHHRAIIEPRSMDQLAPFLARYQGLIAGARAIDLSPCVQSLLCLPLPGGLWETDILPARCERYDPQDLDRLMQASTLMWIGFPGKRIAFCYAEDVDLMADGTGGADGEGERKAPKTADAVRLFADRRGRYRLTDLLGDPPRPAHEVLSRLWDGVWAGRITNDSLAALRRGLAQDFRPSPANERLLPAAPAFPAFRRRRSRLSGPVSAGAVGNWYLVAQPAPVDGWVDAEEVNKDRVRLLLARYGILFRHLLQRELPPFQWPAVFRTLRLMELSGEIHAGCFFEGIPGPQFISGRMRQLLREDAPAADELFWISAQDPASLCGIAIDGLRGRLPRRAAGTHLVYLGARLAMVSQRRGKILNVHLPIDHPRLSDCFSLFDHLLSRRIDAWRSITIETINGQPAPQSPLLDLLRPRFDTVIETHTVTLYRLTDS